MNTNTITLFLSISLVCALNAQTGSYSSLLVQDDGAEIRIKANQTNQNPSGSIIFDESTGHNHFSIIYDGSGGQSDGRLVFNAQGAGDVMTLERNGRVGIGTASPIALLTVEDDQEARIRIRNSAESTNWGLIIEQKPDLSSRVSAEARDLYVTSGWNKTLTLGHEEFDNFGGKIVMPGGNVGIGTTTPSHKLAVNGTVRAKEVIVDTGWSDFVFEDSYKLRSLEEVEDHIEEHGHLPDVPSGALVESEGLSVGEAQKIMMQKIEELTLYMIDVKKENEALKAEVEKLKAN